MSNGLQTRRSDVPIIIYQILFKINDCGLYGWKIIFDRTLPEKCVIDDNLEIIFSTNNFYKYNMVSFKI